MGSFKASTQYGDWEGSVAADNQPDSLQEWLESKHLLKSGELLVAATIYVSEQSYSSPYVKAYVFQNADKFESAREAFATIKGPIPVRQIDIQLTTEEFLSLFKRFDVVLTWHGLELGGREYSVKEK